MAGVFAGKGLPTADRGVDVTGVQFDPTAATAGTFGNDKGATATKKWVEDNKEV
jgi:hypothetical protein